MTRTFTLDELEHLARPAPNDLAILDAGCRYDSEADYCGCGYDFPATGCAHKAAIGRVRALAVAASNLAAFARELLTERDALRSAVDEYDTRLTAVRNAVRPAGFDSVQQYPGGEPVCGFVLSVEAQAERAIVELLALRATVGRLRPVVGIVADWWHLLPDDVQDRIERLLTKARHPHREYVKQALRALLADAPAARNDGSKSIRLAFDADEPFERACSVALSAVRAAYGVPEPAAPERTRPALEWVKDQNVYLLRIRRVVVGFAGVTEWSLLPDLYGPAASLVAALTTLRNHAVAAGFDVPEVPDVG